MGWSIEINVNSIAFLRLFRHLKKWPSTFCLLVFIQIHLSEIHAQACMGLLVLCVL